MVITEEIVATGHARVSFEDGVSVQTANDCRRWRVLASLLRLPADTEEVGDEVSINEVGSINDAACDRVVHVEACLSRDSGFQTVKMIVSEYAPSWTA
jgi:hypothetical protein